MQSVNPYDILQASDTPPMQKLHELFKGAESDMNTIYEYGQDCLKNRFCEWDGRSKDGRKHGTDSSPAFPWPGASDMRTWNIDDLTNKISSVMMLAAYSAKISASMSDKADPQIAGAAEQFMQWYFKKGMPSSKRSLNLVCQWGVSLGSAVLGVFWDEKIIKTSVPVSVDAVVESSDIVDYLNSDELENPSVEAIEDAKIISGYSTKSKVVDFLRRLKTVGTAQVLKDVVAHSRARLKAMRIGRDIFFPISVENIQDSPFVFTKEFLAPNQFRAKAITEGWNKEFVDSVLQNGIESSQVQRASASEATSSKKDYKHCITIVRAYYWAYDSTGSQSLRYCVFSPDCETELYAKSGIMDIQKYPFAIYSFENVESEIVDSRGVAEIAEGWQREIKTQKDFRIDNAAISINPPKVFRVGNRPDSNYAPGALIPAKGGEFRVIENLNVATNPSASIEVENSVKNDMFSYFGNPLMDKEGNPATSQLQAIVADWLEFLGEVLSITFEYCRIYRSDAYRFLPLESEQNEPLEYSPAEVPQGLEFTLGFDVRDLDLDYYLKKFDLASKYIGSYDHNGDTNTSHLLRMVLSRLFPNETKTIVSSSEDSYKREVLQTQVDLATIFSLQPVNAPQHCNAQLRLQIVSDYIQKPAIAQRMNIDKEFSNAIQGYVKQLQFQIAQKQNAVIGRIGAKPASGLPVDSLGLEVGNVNE